MSRQIPSFFLGPGAGVKGWWGRISAFLYLMSCALIAKRRLFPLHKEHEQEHDRIQNITYPANHIALVKPLETNDISPYQWYVRTGTTGDIGAMEDKATNPNLWFGYLLPLSSFAAFFCRQTTSTLLTSQSPPATLFQECT